MDFEIATYNIDQINRIGQSDSPAFQSVKLSFPSNIKFSECNFGLKIETNDFQPDFYSGDTIIFSKKESEIALNNIYLFVTDDNKSIIGEIIHKPDAKNNISSELNNSNHTEYRKARRKSFMTPTPLHIPTSKISPVADSSHERILIQPAGDKKQLVSIPCQKNIYTFPMVFIHKKHFNKQSNKN